MPFVPPHVFAAGAISPVEFDENLTALRAFLQNQIVAADISTGWVEPNHIVLPDYNGVINRTLLAGGVVQGITYIPGDSASATSVALAPGDKTFHDVSQTGLTFRLDHDAIVAIEYNAYPAYVADGWSNDTGGRDGEAWLMLDGIRVYPSMLLKFAETTEYKTHIKPNHAHILTNLGAGTHHIKTVAKADFGCVFQFSWSVQLQAFYF